MAIQPRKPENDSDHAEPPKQPAGGIGLGGWVLLAGLPALIILVAIAFWGGYLGWDMDTGTAPDTIQTPQN